MGVLSHDQRRFADLITELTYCNPFLPERVDIERAILGDRFVALGPVWHAQEAISQNPNVARIGQDTAQVIERIQARCAKQGQLTGRDRKRYRDLVYYSLYDRYLDELSEIVAENRGSIRPIGAYERFWREHRELTRVMGPAEADDADVTHLFACLFQLRRAFHHIFEFIIGGSMAAAKLRANVWQSIFTHDLRRYRHALYDRMGDIVTLVTGPTGTGKELVARAVGMSRYIRFFPQKKVFAADFETSFFPLNLTALSPTLIESELFGHKRGAFTGAVQDRVGWLEVCPEHGTVFLDEIGEVHPAIQVKLLRVLQSRTFQRLGESKDRMFRGKLVAATNRDPALEMAEGRMREDFYYRLCSDIIETPSLRTQIEGNPEELRHLLRYICRKCAGPDEGDRLCDESFAWIRRQLGLDYPWHGNVRELEQCARNIMIRGTYQPASRISKDRSSEIFAQWVDAGETMEDVTRQYCAYVYEKTGSYVQAGRKLGLDRRTLKSKIEGLR